MLMVGSYAKDYGDACRAKVAAQLASYRTVLAAKPSRIEADDFARLSAAFFDEIEKKYP